MGEFAGGVNNDYNSITNSYATGNTYAAGSDVANSSLCSYSGGIIGYKVYSIVKNSYATGSAYTLAGSSRHGTPIYNENAIYYDNWGYNIKILDLISNMFKTDNK